MSRSDSRTKPERNGEAGRDERTELNDAREGRDGPERTEGFDEDETERPIEEYVFGVRILECECDGPDADPSYRFEAPDHVGAAFDALEDARLYADVYFDVNGFVEEGTGDRGIPPEVVQGGKDTMAAYLLTRPWADVYWVASFYGTRPPDIERYVDWVRTRAAKIRSDAAAELE